MLTFWGEILSPSSEAKSKPTLNLAACQFLCWLTLRTEDGASVFLRNTGELLLYYMVFCPRTEHSSNSVLAVKIRVVFSQEI
jgi:hypothetical protein